MAAEEADDIIPGEILISFNEDTSPGEVGGLIQDYGLIVLARSGSGDLYRLGVPEDLLLEEVLQSLNREPLVDYAEANHLCRAAYLPDDPLYPLQWNLNLLEMESAWDLLIPHGTEGEGFWPAAGTSIAILDTGVAYEEYADSKGVYAPAPDLAGTTFLPGYDFINEDDHPNDDNQHGTHLAGVIAQTTDNALGSAGMAPGVSIMPVKVLDENAMGTEETLASGIYFAAEQGAEVINMSLSFAPGYRPGETLRRAIEYAHQRGVIMVASVGNIGWGRVSYPAAFDEVIAVGAARLWRDGDTGELSVVRAEYSNFGRRLDFLAPGGSHWTDANLDGIPDAILAQSFAPGSPTEFGFWLMSGTSVAAAHVSALAALLLAQGEEPDEVGAVMADTAIDMGRRGWDRFHGHGLINARRALAGDDSPERITRPRRWRHRRWGRGEFEVLAYRVDVAGGEGLAVSPIGFILFPGRSLHQILQLLRGSGLAVSPIGFQFGPGWWGRLLSGQGELQGYWLAEIEGDGLAVSPISLFLSTRAQDELNLVFGSGLAVSPIGLFRAPWTSDVLNQLFGSGLAVSPIGSPFPWYAWWWRGPRSWPAENGAALPVAASLLDITILEGSQ